MNCPKCNNKLLTATRMIDSFDVDEEPYESGVKEEGKIVQGNFTVVDEIVVLIEYCEVCDKIISKYIGDDE